MTVEVFKTSVKDAAHAVILISQIHESYPDYKANFDLEDCDNILRVECNFGLIQTFSLIELLKEFGYSAELLADDHPVSLPNLSYIYLNQ
jgi:hypothetical protein